VTALKRRLAAAEATSGTPGEHSDELARLELYAQALPGVPTRRLVVAFLFLALLLAWLLSNPLRPNTQADLLAGLTRAAFELDGGKALDALDKADLVTTFGSLVLVLLVIYVVTFVPITSFRLKRTLFNLYPNARNELAATTAARHVERSEGLYALERRAFAEVGSYAPAEPPLDLIPRISVMLAILIIAGVGFQTVLSPSEVLDTVEKRGFGVLLAGWIAAAGVAGLVSQWRTWRHRVTGAGGRSPGPPNRTAPRTRRAGALGIDAVIVGIATLPLVGLVHLDLIFAIPAAGLLPVLLAGPRGWEGGQTVGKLAFGVTVTRTGDGKPLGLGRALIREAVVKWGLFGSVAWAAVLVPTLLNYLRPFWQIENRAFHDSLVGSDVLGVEGAGLRRTDR
jgi:hypothetical protein